MAISKSPKISDETLANQWAKGDEKAGILLFRRHAAFTLSIALSRVKNMENAKDINQEAWLKAYKNKPFGLNNFRAWIAKITVNAALDFKKRKWNTAVHSMEDEVAENLLTMADLEDQLHYRDLLQKCLKQFPMLPPRQAKCYGLYVREGKSVKEIAAILDISARTVEGHIQKARRRFQKYRESDFKKF